MNINEAIAAHRIIQFALDLRDAAPRAHQGLDFDCAAMILLADKAHKTLGWGMDGNFVRRRWPKPEGWTGKDQP